MKINIIPNDQETRVCLIGELDTTVTTTQVEDLNQVLALTDKALEIDCEELEYISSAGLRFFITRYSLPSLRVSAIKAYAACSMHNPA